MPILIKRADGGVTVTRPATVEGLTLADTVARAIESWKEVHPGQYVSHEEVSDEAIPTDRTFRNAWRAGVGKVEHDMPKCRAIHRERLRAMRRQKFEALDAQWMKATATGDAATAAAAEAKRQQLRDAPTYPAIDAAATPDELKLAVPPILAE